MNIELKVTVEHTWRGPVLDVVSPVLTERLNFDKERENSFSIEKEIKISNSAVIMIWCIYRNKEEYILHIYDSNLKTIFKVESPKPFYSEVILPDGKQYQFQLCEIEQP
jgi:hypothetical protein